VNPSTDWMAMAREANHKLNELAGVVAALVDQLPTIITTIRDPETRAATLHIYGQLKLALGRATGGAS
jgi:hypothetical protein